MTAWPLRRTWHAWPEVTASAVVAAGAAYLVLLSWAIGNRTFDEWGVLVIVPPLGLLGVLALRRMFAGELRPLASIMYAGLALKLVGAAARYWVGFDVYGGGIDAQRYHEFAVRAANDVWAGRADIGSLLPPGTGTVFAEHVTALLYTLTGSSKMAGFVLFSFLAFFGVAFFVKAACVAVPGLERRRYAVLCVLAPSLVYWPSSIGKEALIILPLGAATYGFARLLTRDGFVAPLLLAGGGLTGAAFIRPHLAGIWLAGVFPALLVAVVARARADHPGHRLDQVVLLGVIVVAGVGLALVGHATVRYLNPDGDESTSDSITSIVDETTRRTEQADSNFTPPSLDSPANWPYASLRTLIRPLPHEASGLAQNIAALEITVFLVLCVLCWRRIANLPRLVLTNPFVAFAMTTVLLAGLAYASFANLGVLTRQKSLVFPLLLLVLCVPGVSPKHTQKSSMSPSVSAQFESGGIPASRSARQVRMGPPPGSGTNPVAGAGFPRRMA